MSTDARESMTKEGSGARCNMCRASGLTPLIDFGEHPISKHYLSAPDEVRPTWPVRLFFCESCGMTQLVGSVPPELIYDNYVTLSSWKPQRQIPGQVESIKNLESLGRDARVLEIGCNDGIFLKELVAAGFTNLLGVEPAKDAADAASASGLNVVREFLTPDLSRELVAAGGQFDLVISRENFEHIADLHGVIESIRILLKPGGYVLVEVPNYGLNMQALDYSLWEEHVNYFTEETLRHFISLAGVEPVKEERIVFSGEGLVVYGRRTDCSPTDRSYVRGLKERNARYADSWPLFTSALRQYLQSAKDSGRKVALYGAASRAFCLVNYAGVAKHIDYILDDHPAKQDKFMPGGGIPIVSSAALYDPGVDICLLTVSAENEDTVLGKHPSWVANGGEFWSLFPPSERLLPLFKELS